MIEFTETTLGTLKRLYGIALKEKKASFFFGENEILTGYAKHLIEYLETAFNDGSTQG